MSVITCATTHAADAQAQWPAQLVLQGEPLADLDETLRLLETDGAEPGTRPLPLEAACSRWDSADGAQTILARIRAECQEKESRGVWSLTISAAAQPGATHGPIGTPFEYFGADWASLRVDPEAAREWNESTPAAVAGLRVPITERSSIRFRMALRRDLGSWRGDGAGLNVPLGFNEFDLNEPSLGYFRAEGAHYAFTAGRFPAHWSSSPDFGLTLSNSTPFHDGAEIVLKFPRGRYRFLASSLNPWLEGTPTGRTANEDYPPGSEEYRQRHYASANGAQSWHNRVYDARSKTLFAHRVEGELGPLALGLTETEIIGGKVPDLRDAGPFVVFHNDFKDGYTNSSVGLDASLKLPRGIVVLGEYYVDDVDYSATEKDGNSADLQGWMAGIRHAFAAGGIIFRESLHAVRTDPYLYGYLQPLNTMASRRVLASNRLDPGHGLFADRYVVDYPIGYLRGGDAFDFWYALDAWPDAFWHGRFAAALLSHGEIDLSTPYESYYSHPDRGAPSGVAQRELRLRLDVDRRLPRGFAARAGAAWQGVWNRDHVSGRDASFLQASAGASWSLPH